MTVRIVLHSASESLPSGTELSTVGGGAARLRLAPSAEAYVALPELSRAERRWAVDKTVRRLCELMTVDEMSLAATAAVSDYDLTTIGLDLHHRTDGKLSIEGRAEVADEVRRVGALEDGLRAWVNEDPSTRTSFAIASDVTRWAETQPTVEVEVLTEEALTEQGLGLLLAVGQGSAASPPRLVIARHHPGGASGSPLMLLGKGITFDTGGINVKPYESYVSMMKNDMAGAAVAFHLFQGLVEAGADEPMVLVIPTCENAIGSGAMRPGALVKSHRGHTVRVDHTDAEGRLVLADGLSYVTSTDSPRQVLCFATLTTSALTSYGPYVTPVHFADSGLRTALETASEETGEDLHFFPQRLWHLEANRDKEADLRNTARLPGDASRSAGSRNAAHFLQHFTDAPLCHFDIFASAWNWAGDAPGCGYGATGAPLRTLLRAVGRRSS